VGELAAEISALKLKAAELQLVKQQVEEVSTELRSVHEAKLWLERRLPEVEVRGKCYIINLPHQAWLCSLLVCCG
jgi:hypothetical protein